MHQSRRTLRKKARCTVSRGYRNFLFRTEWLSKIAGTFGQKSNAHGGRTISGCKGAVQSLNTAVRLHRASVRRSPLKDTGKRWLSGLRDSRITLRWQQVAAASVVILASCLATTTGLARDRVSADLHCLALTIYHEARGEPDLGKLAVAHVVINRALDGRFPRRICDVVYQHSKPTRVGCEFSWTCDAVADRPMNTGAWRSSLRIARLVYLGLTFDPTNGAKWYHADYVEPDWAAELGPAKRIGRHLFYRGGNVRSFAALRSASSFPSLSKSMIASTQSGSRISAVTAAFLSDLRVTMIIYARDADDRRVQINNAFYQQGDVLAQGVTLLAINPNEIVVRYEDRWFRFRV